VWFWIIVGVSVAYNFQAGNNKIKLLREYESVTQNILFDNAVGRSIAQAISRRVPTAAARVRAQVKSCEICGG
jgi:hypothetical protein